MFPGRSLHVVFIAMLPMCFNDTNFSFLLYAKRSWSVHVCCLHLKTEFCSCARGVNGVASFITTDEQLQLNRGCCFLVQAMLAEGFAFHQFYYGIFLHDMLFFSGPPGSRIVCCLDFKIECRSCARDVSGVASFIAIDEQLQ